MFEDSMMESGGKIKSKTKYWMIASSAFWGTLLLITILIPLIYPEALPKNSLAASIAAPPPPPPTPPPPPPPAAPVPKVKMVSEIDQGLHAPTKIPKDIKMLKEEAAPPPASMGVMGSGMAGGTAGGVMGGMLGGAGTGPAITVAKPKPTGPARISGGVIAGNILTKTQPIYPPIARAAHQGGTVVLHAIISKNGTIESLSVISGPAMLVGAATDAVKQWRYKPYLLNGEPTEVDTTIMVNFNLNGG